MKLQLTFACWMATTLMACSGSVDGTPRQNGDDDVAVGDSLGDVDADGDSPGDAGDGAPADNDTLTDYAPDDGPVAGSGPVITVSDTDELLAAIAAADPGDEITLEDGVYDLDAIVQIDRPGSSAQRIFVRAKNPLGATIQVCALIGFRVTAPFWIFEDLVIHSTCTNVSNHAFQVVGTGSDLILRRNRSQDFYAHVKLNGDGAGTWPDRFWAIDNEWRNTAPIDAGGAPFNVLNLDGGDGHVVRRNRFVDIATAIDQHASSIYLKATTRDAIIEQNLVVCVKSLTTVGPTRGIWGGDAVGSGGICDGDCANLRNINRNNIVMRCETGSGNRFGLGSSYETNVVYLHHLVHRVTQNFYGATNVGPVEFKANLLYAGFLTPGAAMPVLADNITPGAAGMATLFVDPDNADFTKRPGQTLPEVSRDARAPHDFCGHPRRAITPIGPIEYADPRAADCLARIKALYDDL